MKKMIETLKWFNANYALGMRIKANDKVITIRINNELVVIRPESLVKKSCKTCRALRVHPIPAEECKICKRSYRLEFLPGNFVVYMDDPKHLVDYILRYVCNNIVGLESLLAEHLG